MPEKKSRPPRTMARILATIFWIVTLSALVIAFIPQAILFVRSDLNRIKAEQIIIANHAANQVSKFVQEKYTSLALTAALVEPGAHSREDQVGVLGHVLSQNSAFRTVILIGPDGHELTHSTRFTQVEVDSLMQRVESVQSALLEGEAQYISPVYINEDTSEPLVVMAVPVKDLFGDLQGSLLAEVNLKFMWDLVGGIQVGRTGSAFVVNTNGDVLAHRDISRVLAGENLSQMAVVEQFLNGAVQPGGSVFNYNDTLNDKAGVTTLVNLGVPNWGVMTYMPLVEAARELLINFGISFVIVLVLAGLTALFGVFIARRQAVPLVELTNVSTSIAEGDLSLSAAVQGSLEEQQLARAFNTMTIQLRNLIGSLEQQVADRTRALETSTEVSRRLSTILDRDQLVREVVEQLQTAFGYYHAQIYLCDETKTYLEMVGGTGDAGRTLVARGHKLGRGQGLVGQAAVNMQSVLIPDVSQEPGWLPNPLLPETKSELAVPITIGDQLLGVLDVQHDVIEGLGQDDLDLIQGIASQVAIAIQNAQAYQTVESRAEREAYLASVGQRIQAAGTVEDVLQIAVKELGQALEAEVSSVALKVER